MGRRTPEFILGLTGSVLGLVLGVIVVAFSLVFGLIGGVFSALFFQEPEVEELRPFLVAGLSFLLFSTFGAIGSFVVRSSAKVGGSIMSFCAVAGTVAAPLYVFPSGLLLGIAGLMGLLRKGRARPVRGRHHRWVGPDTAPHGHRTPDVFGPTNR